MKKLLFVLAICCLIVGCGDKQEIPEGISEEAYSHATKTVKIMEDYSAGKLDGEETITELYEIEIDTDKLFDEEYFNSLERNSEGELVDNSSKYPRDVSVYVSILDIRTQMSTIRLDIKDEDKKESINLAMEITDELAEKINYKD